MMVDRERVEDRLQLMDRAIAQLAGYRVTARQLETGSE